MSESASNRVAAVHRRSGVNYSLDLPAPSTLSLSPHVEVISEDDDHVQGWELTDL